MILDIGHSTTWRIWWAARELQSRLGRLQERLRRSVQGVLAGQRKHLHADEQRGLCAARRARGLWRQQEVSVWRRDEWYILFNLQLFAIKGMPNTRTSKSTPKPITTNWRSTATKAMRAIRWMILGTDRTTVHSPRTIATMIEAHWIAPACSRYAFYLFYFLLLR